MNKNKTVIYYLKLVFVFVSSFEGEEEVESTLNTTSTMPDAGVPLKSDFSTSTVSYLSSESKADRKRVSILAEDDSRHDIETEGTFSISSSKRRSSFKWRVNWHSLKEVVWMEFAKISLLYYGDEDVGIMPSSWKEIQQKIHPKIFPLCKERGLIRLIKGHLPDVFLKEKGLGALWMPLEREDVEEVPTFPRFIHADVATKRKSIRRGSLFPTQRKSVWDSEVFLFDFEKLMERQGQLYENIDYDCYKALVWEEYLRFREYTGHPEEADEPETFSEMSELIPDPFFNQCKKWAICRYILGFIPDLLLMLPINTNWHYLKKSSEIKDENELAYLTLPVFTKHDRTENKAELAEAINDIRSVFMEHSFRKHLKLRPMSAVLSEKKIEKFRNLYSEEKYVDICWNEFKTIHHLTDDQKPLNLEAFKDLAGEDEFTVLEFKIMWHALHETGVKIDSPPKVESPTNVITSRIAEKVKVCFI